MGRPSSWAQLAFRSSELKNFSFLDSLDNHHTVIVSIVTPFRQQHLHFLVPDPRRVSSGQIEKCTLSKRFAQFLRKTCISFYEYVQEAERNKLRSEAKTCLVYNRKWREVKTLSVCAQNGTEREHDDQEKRRNKRERGLARKRNSKLRGKEKIYTGTRSLSDGKKERRGEGKLAEKLSERSNQLLVFLGAKRSAGETLSAHVSSPGKVI